MSQTPTARKQGRSPLLPFFVAVIVISLIVIAITIMNALEDEDGLPDVKSDPAITAFWVSEAGPLLNESRLYAPDRVQHVNDGQSCRPTEEVKGVNCGDLPEFYRGYARGYERFAERARGMNPPSGTSAEEWWNKQIDAWEAFVDDYERFAAAAVAGYQDEEWAKVLSEQQGPSLQSEAELLLAAMLPEVEKSQRSAPMAVNP